MNQHKLLTYLFIFFQENKFFLICTGFTCYWEDYNTPYLIKWHFRDYYYSKPPNLSLLESSRPSWGCLVPVFPACTLTQLGKVNVPATFLCFCRLFEVAVGLMKGMWSPQDSIQTKSTDQTLLRLCVLSLFSCSCTVSSFCHKTLLYSCICTGQ